MDRPVTHRDLQHLHMWIRVELALQTLVVLGVLTAIYFGTVASNQAAGALGMSVGEAVEQSAQRTREEFRKQWEEAERLRQEREKEGKK